jgi:hypothetical protein
VQSLTGTNGRPAPAPTDHARIFDLLYTRLACLCLIDATALAAQEAKALEDLHSAFYVDDLTGAHLAPWPLRVLNVRLQAVGFGDPRRAVMSYHELARDARSHVAAALQRHDHSASELWKARLAELGWKVAGALVEMGDLPGAALHLASLNGKAAGDKLDMARALVWLQIGDTEAARRCVGDDAVGERIVSALCDMADGEFEAALPKWQRLKGELDGDEMVLVNMAVCLLYVGRMPEVSSSLSLPFANSGQCCSWRGRNASAQCAHLTDERFTGPGDT